MQPLWDDSSLIVGSNLKKSSPRWRIVEKSNNGLPISKGKVGGMVLLTVAWRKI